MSCVEFRLGLDPDLAEHRNELVAEPPSGLFGFPHIDNAKAALDDHQAAERCLTSRAVLIATSSP